MKKIDLKNSRHVRKVTSEATGTHFEICMKKKAYVFVSRAQSDWPVGSEIFQIAERE